MLFPVQRGGDKERAREEGGGDFLFPISFSLPPPPGLPLRLFFPSFLALIVSHFFPVSEIQVAGTVVDAYHKLPPARK